MRQEKTARVKTCSDRPARAMWMAVRLAPEEEVDREPPTACRIRDRRSEVMKM